VQFVGCNSPATQEIATSPVASVDSTAHAANELYTDEDIERLAPFNIEQNDGKVCLEVVPNGTSRPRQDVFRELGLDEARLRDLRTSGIMNFAFVVWQVSRSYDISCMTANNDPEGNGGLALTDPQRRVYGIRLLKRSPPLVLRPSGYIATDDDDQ